MSVVHRRRVWEVGGVVDVVWFIALALGVAGLAWLLFGTDPHWASKDGRRFICRVQGLDDRLANDGLPAEVRVTVVDDIVEVRPRGLRAIRYKGHYRVTAKAPSTSRKRSVYLLRADGEGRQIALRVPTTSRCAPVLDALAGQARGD